MMLDFPNAPVFAETFEGWEWDGHRWLAKGTVPTPPPVLANKNSGKLIRVTNTLLSYVPRNGDRIKVNGSLLQIPYQGFPLDVSGLTTAGLYYAFLRDDGTTVAHSASSASHEFDMVTAENIGVRIAVIGGVPDPALSLVGMFYLTGSPLAVTDDPSARHVASWLNREPKEISFIFPAFALSSGPALTTPDVRPPPYPSALFWADDAMGMVISVPMPPNTTATETIWCLMDGVPFGRPQVIRGFARNAPAPGGCEVVSESRHEFSVGVYRDVADAAGRIAGPCRTSWPAFTRI